MLTEFPGEIMSFGVSPVNYSGKRMKFKEDERVIVKDKKR